MQQALDSPAAAKGLDDSYQPVPDVRDDPAYFARLYDQYATDVLRVCYFYLSDREKAEDVCQDVFVRLMTTHPLLQPGAGKIVAAEGSAEPLPRFMARRLAQARHSGRADVRADSCAG